MRKTDNVRTPICFYLAVFGFILLILIAIVDFISLPKNMAQTPCPLCAEACEIFHTTRVESKHREAPNYYYYTYKCKACGNEFTLEIVQE